MAEYQRPHIPYDPAESLPYNNRFDLTAANNQPPTAAQLDGDINYLIDAANALYEAIQAITVGVLPGANDPNNINKFTTTNGEDPATIVWTFVQEQNIDDAAISTDKIQDGAVTTDKLGDGSVTTDKIAPEAVTNDLIADGAVNTNELADNAVTSPKIAANAVTTTQIVDNAITTAKIVDNAVTSDKIADGAVGATQVANNSITNQQLAVIAQIPVGGIIDFGGTTAPAGWLSCIGQAVSRATYAALFTAIGTLFGTGDGATTFNLPDCRGRVLVGLDSAQANTNAATNSRVTTTQTALTNGGNGGAEIITLTTAQIPSHTHGFQQASAPSATASGGGGAQVFYQNNSTQTTATGGGGSHPNMPPYLFAGKIIYAGV